MNKAFSSDQGNACATPFLTVKKEQKKKKEKKRKIEQIDWDGKFHVWLLTLALCFFFNIFFFFCSLRASSVALRIQHVIKTLVVYIDM